MVTTWFRYNAQPVYVAYGSGGDVYVDNSIVYVNGEKYSSAEDYYSEAKSIADAAPEIDEADANNVEWLPLGVFGVMRGGATETDTYMQLAVSKDGMIGGTYSNDATDVARPLEGMVDKDSQRAAWSFADGKDKDVVMETSIYNLTENESTALLHFGPERSEEVKLIRVEAPKDSNEATAP